MVRVPVVAGAQRTSHISTQGRRPCREEDWRRRSGAVRARSGAFRRALALPAEIDENKVDASFAEGVLKITIAKQPEGKSATRKIEISAD